MVNFLQRMGARSKPLVPLDPGQIGPWVAGANTSILEVTDRERCTITGGSNPRMTRELTGLTIGATYKVRAYLWMGSLSAPSIFVRVATTITLPTGGPLNQFFSAEGAFDLNFVASAATLYFGPVAVTSIIGEFFDITLNPDFLVV